MSFDIIVKKKKKLGPHLILFVFFFLSFPYLMKPFRGFRFPIS